MLCWENMRVHLVAVCIAAVAGTQVAARDISFSVKVGDRMKDLVEDLTGQGYTTSDLVARVAGRERFAEYSFVPPPVQSMQRFEGIPVPGTYQIRVSDNESVTNDPYQTTRIIVRSLLRTARERLSGIRPPAGLSLYEVITLASIVEKEAVSNTGYNMVASVFFNRLSRNSPLCSCPTVEYGLGYHRPYLLFRDLQVDTPYNVYRYRGLPPTPVAFFSDEALRSVAYPVRTSLYYFVYDWTNGELYFAERYEEHRKNAARSRKNFRRVFGSQMMYKKFPDVFYNASCLPDSRDGQAD